MSTSYEFKMGNDNGNANHDAVINNTFLTQPNVNRRIFNLKGYDNVSTTTALSEINDRIVATITSPSVSSGIYLIGHSALNSGKKPNEFMVGYEKKSNSEIPMINTLGLVSAYAVKNHYEKTRRQPQNGDTINVSIEMTTALPIREYYEDKKYKEVFTEKYLTGPHTVMVHLGEVNVKVNIEFNKVYVTPEASSVYWFLDSVEGNEELSNELFKELMEEYNLESVSGKKVSKSRILHVDIGSGTTEFPLTTPSPDPAFITGKDLGIGHAIDAILSDFGNEINIPELTRLEFDQILRKERNPQFHTKAYNKIEPFLREQANDILEELNRQLRAARLDVDYILVYGGGSIPLKEFMYEEVKSLAESTGKAQVIYAPASLAVKMNALGLNAFVNHEVFQKKTADQTAKVAESVE
ncbi:MULTISPECIES: ParM/StbA family protein [Bacillus cereus group]|uniref:ParM/StbA family protein n=1 Tax=Bacillus cereus group TaxID=86661 RepID=UPI0022E46D19|nr:ParM/StbA family protein [Bacillus cereus group sp. TH152-1LC]MDA1674541.1 ParM/StbA family protein [Bacillus cereus group sp. TH152-1LC]